MYRKISDFVDDWSYESEITLKLFNNLTDEILNKKFHENVRTAGRLSWHMINSIGEMVQRTGLDFEAEVDDTKIPATSKEIYDAFKISSLNMLEAVKNNWNDSSLDEEVEMYGEMWKKGKVLSSLSKHNTHHRAELIVVMRLAGLKVVGPYGPSKEEWANYGMQPQE
ncbi:MAG: DinB family protein [Ignavibacteriaceae bacterium]|jgi:uncharacterized damage-inducible protein DinB